MLLKTAVDRAGYSFFIQHPRALLYHPGLQNH
jgi:hypothetical protein